MNHDEFPADLRARLERVMGADYVEVWLQSPVPLLDGRMPLEVIHAGELNRVAAIVAELEYPAAS